MTATRDPVGRPHRAQNAAISGNGAEQLGQVVGMAFSFLAWRSCATICLRYAGYMIPKLCTRGKFYTGNPELCWRSRRDDAALAEIGHRGDSSLGSESGMRKQYRIRYAASAARELEKMSRLVAQRVQSKILKLADGLAGDVKRLTNYTPEYRLRVGDWRVLFGISDDVISIDRVSHRSEAY